MALSALALPLALALAGVASGSHQLVAADAADYRASGGSLRRSWDLMMSHLMQTSRSSSESGVGIIQNVRMWKILFLT